VDVEDRQTATLFADAVRALETLPPAMKAARLSAIAAFVQPERSDVRPLDQAQPSRTRPRLRPMVFEHPTTGAPVLFVNEQHVERVEGLAPADSRALLEAVFAHLYAPANIFEHRWRMGDLLVWDNIGLQHGRRAVDGVSRRRLQRASVAERSLLEQVPDFFEMRGAASM
jgi:alpha-ketoglutarate-dependent taurine dioxygenase